MIHASGSPDGLQLALRIAGFEATIIEMSWFGDRQVAASARRAVSCAPADDQVVAGRAASRRPSARDGIRAGAWQLALSLLADPALDVLITGESAFDDLARRDGCDSPHAPGDTLCHRIKYQ